MLRYLITDRSRLPAASASHPEDHSPDPLLARLLARILARILALAPTLDYVQIRERDLPAATLEQFTRRVLLALAPLPKSPRLLINHRPDVALASADVALSYADVASPEKIPGVHLRSGPGELSPTQVRALYSALKLPPPVISSSCHSLDDVRRAANQNVNLILYGPVFEKTLPARPHLPGVGLSHLADACRAAQPVPVLALGGVSAANTAACLSAGAAGIAGIRLFLDL